MKRTMENLKAEALEHRIAIATPSSEKVEFTACDGTDCPVAWMYKNASDNWTGFTRNPEVTGRKRGTKSEVMDWCLDWAINGF